MKEIKLTQGKVALVDDEDYEWLNQWSWHAYKGKHNKNNFYARRGDNKNKKIIHMHREILGLTDPKILVDHLDKNGLNNCRSNLRIANGSQNMANRSSAKNSSSKYLGVGLYKKNMCWQAKIRKGDKYFFLGYFKNEKDAALAYNKKAVELHGDFASLNIID